MQTLLVIVFFLVWSTACLAKSYVVLERGDGRVAYAELYSVRKTTEGALVWRIEDLRHPDILGHLSKLFLEEIDCVGRRARTRLEQRYSGRRATGRSTRVTVTSQPWRPVPTDAGPDGTLLRSVCPLVR